MLTFLARMKVQEGREQEFIDLMKQLTEKTLVNEPGVKLYQFYRLRDEERGFAVLEAFVDEAAEQAHLDTEHFHELAPGILDCLDGTYVREYLELLEP